MRVARRAPRSISTGVDRLGAFHAWRVVTSMPKEPEHSPQEPEAHRADRFAIGHDAFQFKLDFWQSAADGDESAIVRIKTSPPIAKDLSQTLHESVNEYERRFGVIAPLDPSRAEQASGTLPGFDAAQGREPQERATQQSEAQDHDEQDSDKT